MLKNSWRTAMREVAFSCNDAGSPFLSVTVWSLLSHYASDEPLRINIFEGWGGHSVEHKNALKEIVSKFPFAQLRYIDVEKPLAKYVNKIGERPGSRWNIFTWTPVFTPLLIPEATGNVIHFDIDMLFNADVSPLFELDLSNHLISCSYEYDKFSGPGHEIWDSGILKPEVERYFNTGVLIFNAEKCRAEKTWEKIVDWYTNHRDIAERIEQDAWNALYHDKVLPLHVKWNFHDRNIKTYARSHAEAKYWLGNDPRECLEAATSPCILHFWGPKKPWKPSHRPYRKLYHAAMRAVKLKPPREQLTAFIDDFKTSRRLDKFREILKIPPELFTKVAPKMDDIIRCMRRRKAVKSLKHALLLPFEWLGIYIGITILPRVKLLTLIRIADTLSSVMYFFDGRGKRQALANLHVIMGCEQGNEGTFMFDAAKAQYNPTPRERKIIKGAYRNMARAVAHAFWTYKNAEAKVREAGEMSPKVKAFLAENRPAVTVSGHIGCWEILSQLAFLEGHRIMSVAKDIGSKGITRLLTNARSSIGQEIVSAKGAFRPLMAGIKDGKSIGLLIDQRVDPADGGVWVRFLGRPVCLSAAPAFFATKGKAPLLIAWSRPLPNGRYRCEWLELISPDEAKDIWATTQKCARAIEGIIKRHPSRWALNYNLFCLGARTKDLEALTERESKQK
ncbi:MAG: hypothetical protein J6R80_03050 [Kiritimatiellae bacterium]|nr:hypothetical protein [Kiritimatiellia bacterium]